MRYKRSRATGAAFFFTIVTHKRQSILCHDCNVALLRESFSHVMPRHPFTFDAFVHLPDHLHCIWTLPENDNDFSNRWRQIKGHFSRNCSDECRGNVTAGHKDRGEQAVWQRRFWEHQIRDESDFIRHVEYIHYNPVKHGLVNAPAAWPHSTFRRYVTQGLYHAEWGANKEIAFDQNIGNE